MASYPQHTFFGNIAESGFISPQYLEIKSPEMSSSPNDGSPKVRLISYRGQLYCIHEFIQPDSGVKFRDVGILQPGKEYQLSQDPIPTPQSILDGSYLAALERSRDCPDVIVVVPRLPKHCGAPSLPSIIFSVDGRAGPCVSDLLLDNAVVDHPSDLVFRDRVWKQTSLTINVSHDPHLWPV
jgi:hypothetical protein